MWVVDRVDLGWSTLDLRSSGQGHRDVRQLYFDDMCVANAVDSTSWNEEGFQLHICEDCGFERCEPGDFASLRRSGECFFLIPAFELMGEDRKSLERYQPPEYLLERGSIVLRADAYGELREQNVELPIPSTVAPLSSAEVALMVQFEAPAMVLGTFPEPPRVLKDYILWAEGDLDQLVAELDALIGTYTALDLPIEHVQKIQECDTPTFHLDTQPGLTWRPLKPGPSNAALCLKPGLALIPGTAATTATS